MVPDSADRSLPFTGGCLPFCSSLAKQPGCVLAVPCLYTGHEACCCQRKSSRCHRQVAPVQVTDPKEVAAVMDVLGNKM